MQHQSLGYLIGYLSFDAVFEQSPFEGIRKFCSLIDVQSQSTNFVAGLLEHLPKCFFSLHGHFLPSNLIGQRSSSLDSCVRFEPLPYHRFISSPGIVLDRR
jgi:hypothetical protein